MPFEHKALSPPTSRNTCGYWQGRHLPDLVWEDGENPDPYAATSQRRR
jgi:hypothetical protein